MGPYGFRARGQWPLWFPLLSTLWHKYKATTTFLPASLLCKFIMTRSKDHEFLHVSRSYPSTNALENWTPNLKLSLQPLHWKPALEKPRRFASQWHFLIFPLLHSLVMELAMPAENIECTKAASLVPRGSNKEAKLEGIMNRNNECKNGFILFSK